MNKDHYKIWRSIDKIAYVHGMSVSSLAKKAGLDSTAFNKSKRFYPTGKFRWPSTESICKVLRVMNINWQEFSRYLQEAEDELMVMEAKNTKSPTK
ncbi:helix-turn-helix transcriptional regulator [bacterium]|nr:helix-turn-helix transcriptional regulator [bacterium]